MKFLYFYNHLTFHMVQNILLVALTLLINKIQITEKLYFPLELPYFIISNFWNLYYTWHYVGRSLLSYAECLLMLSNFLFFLLGVFWFFKQFQEGCSYVLIWREFELITLRVWRCFVWTELFGQMKLFVLTSDRPKQCFTVLPKQNRTSQSKFCFPNWNRTEQNVKGT